MGFDHIALAAGRRQAHRPRPAQRAGARRAHRLRLPHGAAAHRRGAHRLDRQHAAAAADRGGRRRPHGHRHRHRVARLLPGAGGEVPRALRDARRGAAARRACAPPGARRSARSPRNSSRTRGRSARSAQAAAREGREPRVARAAAVLGRLHHRLPQADDRQPQLHAQPRGDREGPRGRHPLRRGPHAGARRGGPVRPRRGARGPRGAASPASGEHTLPARSILVAAGTQPNTVLAREDADHFVLDGRYFRAVDDEGNPVTPERSSKPATPNVLLSRDSEDRYMSFFGDLHPSFSGNVVKAMGSAKLGYPGGEPRAGAPARRVRPPMPARSSRGSTRCCARACTASSGSRPTSSRWWCTRPWRRSSSSPASSSACRTSRRSRREVDGTRLAMEGLALTGAWVDREKGLVSTIVLEMGGSSDLCAMLKPGEPVILMGPTGTPTETPGGETVVLAGGGLGNAVLFSIGAALRAAGSQGALLRRLQEAHRPLQGGPDRGGGGRGRVVLRRGAGIRAGPAAGQGLPRQHRGGDEGARRGAPRRRVDRARGSGPAHRHRLRRDDGRGGAARATASSRRTSRPSHVAIGSINSPMQCMMKEICAQCLQPHVRPGHGKDDLRLLLLQPGPGARPRRLPRACASAWGRTRCRRSSRRCGSTAA